MPRLAPFLEEIPEGWSVTSTHDELLDFESVPMLIASNFKLTDDYSEVLVDGRLKESVLPADSVKRIPNGGILIVVMIVADSLHAETHLGSLESSEVFKGNKLDVAEVPIQEKWEAYPRNGAGRAVLLRALDGNRVSIQVFFSTTKPSGQELRQATSVLGSLRMPAMTE